MKRVLFCVVLGLTLFTLNSFGLTYEFDGDEGWTAGWHVANFGWEGGKLVFDTTGGDPAIFSPDNLGLPGTSFRTIHLDIEISGSSDLPFQLFYSTNAETGMNDEKSIYFTVYPGRSSYLLNIPEKLVASNKPNKWDGQTIKQFRLDPGGLSGVNVKIDWITLGDTWEFNTNGNFEGWGGWGTVKNQQVTGGYLYFEFNGTDPYMQFVPGISSQTVYGGYHKWLIADIDYTATNPDNFQLFFTNAQGEGVSEAKSIIFYCRPGRYTYLVHIPQRLNEEGKSDTWTNQSIYSLRFDTGGQASGSVKIYSFKLRRGPEPDPNNMNNITYNFDLIPSGGRPGHKQGWYIGNNITSITALASGALEVKPLSTSGDPYFCVNPQYFNPTEYKYVVVRKSITGFEHNNPEGWQFFGFPGQVAVWFTKIITFILM